MTSIPTNFARLIPVLALASLVITPRALLQTAGVEIGRTYPERIVSHAIAHEVALEALDVQNSWLAGSTGRHGQITNVAGFKASVR